MTYQTLAAAPDISKKWAVTLSCSETEKLEWRVAKIVEYLAENETGLHHWVISDIDATGSYGDRLTRLGNNSETFSLSPDELLTLLSSEGQAIELETTLVKDERECYKIIIRDGLSVDVLGSGELFPALSRGTYIPMDRELFIW